MSRARIEFSQGELETICRRRAVKRLALFGGRKVDLVEVEFLNAHTRRHVLEHTEELYAA